MLAETEPIATAADGWLAQFEEALAHPGDLLETVSSGQLLARRPGSDVAHQDDARFGHDL